MLDGACLISSKNSETVFSTVRSPGHVSKLLKILASAESKPVLDVDAEAVFAKNAISPTLRDAEQKDQVLVTGDTKYLAGFLESEAFQAEANDSNYIIKVKDDLPIADIIDGLKELTKDWGWKLLGMPAPAPDAVRPASASGGSSGN